MTIIRLAKEEDLPGILAIYNDIIINTTAVYDYHPHTLRMRREWFDAKQENGFPVFVAADGETIAGFASYGPFRAWAAYQYTVENSVYVAESFRGQGVAKRLLSTLVASARLQGLHAMIAGIDATNEASIRLHTLQGFEEVAFFREVGFKFNRWLDLKFYELLLKN